jgi:chorismate dehydratase
MQRFWKHQPEFIDAPENYLDHVGGSTAAVVIGDRAFGESMKHPFVYDLAACWQQFTGLPFVFALWISLKPISPSHEVELNNALNMGISQAEEAAEEVLDQYPDYFEVKNYLTHSISYTFDSLKRKGLETFLQMLSNPDDL